MHAISRILLHDAINSIQCSWVKLGGDLCRGVLNGRVNDLGGMLMEETISRVAGADNGSYKTISHSRRSPSRSGGRCASGPHSAALPPMTA